MKVTATKNDLTDFVNVSEIRYPQNHINFPCLLWLSKHYFTYAIFAIYALHGKLIVVELKAKKSFSINSQLAHCMKNNMHAYCWQDNMLDNRGQIATEDKKKEAVT